MAAHNQTKKTILHLFHFRYHIHATFRSLCIACPTTTLPSRMLATSLCTICTSAPAERQTWFKKPSETKHKEQRDFKLFFATHFISLTIFDVLWSDAADSCPVVCYLLCGLHIFVIDALPKLVHNWHTCQDAVLSVRTNSHHLTVNGHCLSEA